MLGFKITEDRSTAVSLTEYWRPLTSVPAGTKVQLLTIGRVAVYGQVTESNKSHFLAWAPAPMIPDWLRN